jgi:glyoxylase-like metal-dependent hydrolase (beta-lactamase superfamily II)
METPVDIEEQQRPLQLQILPVGPMQAVCYLVSDKATDDLMVIDPGGDADLILESIRMMNAEPLYLVNTHGHGDHIAANAELKREYPDAQLCIHASDAGMLLAPEKNLSAFFGGPILSPPADRLLKEGDDLVLGECAFRVIHLPGHTPGGIALYWPGTDSVAGMIFTGDALFAGGVGRTDFPDGDDRSLLSGIREKVLTLPDDTLVLPGHGPGSTVGCEKATNPFFADV